MHKVILMWVSDFRVSLILILIIIMDRNINANIEALENEKIYYPGTEIERIVELTGGGRGDYCCVPGRKNSRYNHLHEEPLT